MSRVLIIKLIVQQVYHNCCLSPLASARQRTGECGRVLLTRKRNLRKALGRQNRHTASLSRQERLAHRLHGQGLLVARVYYIRDDFINLRPSYDSFTGID